MISVIIPNYNGEESLKNNLPRVVSALGKYNYEVMVVDDGSLDQSIKIVENLAKENKRLRLLQNEKNIGFPGTVNRGVNHARGEVLVLLNSDVYPKANFLDAALVDLKEKQVFGVGMKDESIEDGKTIMRGRGIGEWKKGFLVHAAGSLDKSDNLWASGGSSVFNKNIWEKLGGLDELYAPFYWEDIDISYRARKAGYKVLFEKESVVVHEHEKGAIRKMFTKTQVKRIAYTNQFIFVWKNASALLVLSNIVWLPYHMLKSILSLDLSFIIGFLSFLMLLPKVLVSRWRVAKLFKLKDSQVIIKE